MRSATGSEGTSPASPSWRRCWRLRPPLHCRETPAAEQAGLTIATPGSVIPPAALWMDAHSLGFDTEARDFMRIRAATGRCRREATYRRIMYGIGGEERARHHDEHTLDHLSGYGGA